MPKKTMMKLIVTSLFLSSAAFAMGVAPKGGGASSQPTSCETAKDCKGILSHLCKKCPDGEHGGCMHWKCEANQCVRATCEKD